MAGYAAVAFYFIKARRRIKRFMEAADNETPSEFAQYVDLAARVFITRAAQSLDMRDKNAASVEVRQQNAVDKAVITDVLSGSHPLAGVIMNMYPNLTKSIIKNKALIPLALETLAKINQGKGDNGHIKDVPMFAGIDNF